MSKCIERICPDCLKTKNYRGDQKGCGCIRRGEVSSPARSFEMETDESGSSRVLKKLVFKEIKTKEELIDECKIDTSEWEIYRWKCGSWTTGMKPPVVGTNEHWERKSSEPIYSRQWVVMVWMRPKKNVVAIKNEIEELKKLALDFAPKPRPKPTKILPKGNVLEVDLSDHHFGKLAWSEETGHKNYDLKIATKMWWDALESILARSSSYKFDEIWFVVGNDLLNSDDTDSRTTKGTYVNSDTRYQKTFGVVRNVMIESIERLRELCNKVRVFMVSGNHDFLSVWHLGDSLEAYFHNYKDVEIDNSPRYYKYAEYGLVMVMYTHGDKGKRTDYPLLMATEQPEMFGRTKYREAHVGHRHYTKLDEHHGVRVRQLSSLSPPDAWHAENAFVGNLRVAEGLIWNKDEGLIGAVYYTDPEERN